MTQRAVFEKGAIMRHRKRHRKKLWKKSVSFKTKDSLTHGERSTKKLIYERINRRIKAHLKSKGP